MVKRYDFYDRNDDAARKHLTPCGKYVTYSDYAELRAIADALEAALIGTLNFITNTETELGVILGCADKARIALAQYAKVK